jgi:3-deoxy-D-manno-octulosonate 8-phosphate phosphatase (KDO 8-P phosphatase)
VTNLPPNNPDDIPDQLGRVRLLALDVDGVLTDGSFIWGPDDVEMKRFCFHDIMGLSRARKAGLILALVSGETSPLIDRLAGKMQITDVFKGCKDKARAVVDLIERYQLSRGEVCFMGDDINDVGAMQAAGMGAAPPGAHPSALAAANWITQRGGGDGAVRELIDAILKAREKSAGT